MANSRPIAISDQVAGSGTGAIAADPSKVPVPEAVAVPKYPSELISRALLSANVVHELNVSEKSRSDELEIEMKSEL